MLDMAIGAHSQCASVGELVYWDTRECELCGHACEYWKQFSEIVRPPHFHDAAFSVFKTPYIIDSSKKTRWASDSLKTVERYKIIRLVRDGYDRLLTSKEKFGVVSKDSIQKWVRRESRIEKFLQGKAHLTVRYEDVCDGDGLQNCCEFLGIEYEPGMREFWKVRHHGVSGSQKAYSLIRAYHGLPLNDQQQKFFDQHGFELKQREKKRFMEPAEEALWKKYGEPMNRKLGYA